MLKITLNLIFIVFAIQVHSQTKSQNSKIDQTLDSWHKAAAAADFDTYFNLMTPDAVFIGTDATENWQLDEFKEFSKPFFDRGKAWSFTSLDRNTYISQDIAYFDELLNTQMGICRGSGVLKLDQGGWKIAHYVLSIAVPNENVSALTELKKDWDVNFIKRKKN